MCISCSDPEMAERRRGTPKRNERAEDEAYERWRDAQDAKQAAGPLDDEIDED